MAFDGGDLKPLRDQMIAQSHSDPVDAAATLIGVSTIEQLLGDQASGLAHQAEALRLHRLYRSSWPASLDALRVLAFKAAGDVSTNTPLEFLLEGSDVVLYSLYIVPGQPLPEVPEHDIAIVTVGESDRDRPVMREIERLIQSWPCPVLNRPDRVQQLSREVLQVGQGSLYPALHRLEYKGWIKAEWGDSENNRKAKFYALTKRGEKQLAAELENWERLAGAIALVLKEA